MNRELYEFIDSKAIREHLIKINYEFKPMEAALVIYQSKNKNLKEKHNAYGWIIENTGDFKIESRNIEKEIMFHELLKRYIAIENGILEDIMKQDEDSVYTYYEYWEGDEYTADGNGIFVSYSELINAVRKDKYNSLWINKKQVSKDDKHGYDKTFEYIADNADLIWGAEYADSVHLDFCNCSDLNLPVPFVPGDIISIDCRPYAKVKHAVILQLGDNHDCCSVQCASISSFNGEIITAH